MPGPDLLLGPEAGRNNGKCYKANRTASPATSTEWWDVPPILGHISLSDLIAAATLAPADYKTRWLRAAFPAAAAFRAQPVKLS